ncbi:MAG: TIGR01459 family HAD-type hydrolase [Hyphomicrobiales bacterium]
MTLRPPELTDVPRLLEGIGIGACAGHYGAWLCDLWGVVHNGIEPFSAALKALRAYRRAGGVVVFITNAPRPSSSVIAQLERIGVPDDAYDGIVTSGDIMRNMMRAHIDAAVFHIGPQRDFALLAGLPLRVAAAPEDAELVVCSGLIDDSQTPNDYADLLARIRDCGLVFYCANPDKRVHRGNRLIYCAGALAQHYAALGGEVILTGKPASPIYDEAFNRLRKITGKSFDVATVLAIGDGVETDLAGAAHKGLDAVFITGGIHSAEIGNDYDETARLAVMARLRNKLPELRLVGLMRALG